MQSRELILSEVEYGILERRPEPSLNLERRIIRGLDLVTLLLSQHGWQKASYASESYGFDYVDLNYVGGYGQLPQFKSKASWNVNIKLVEPKHFVSIQSANVVTVLSELVPEAWVVWINKPNKGFPTVLPVKDSNHVEQDVVRGVFFCLRQLGISFEQNKHLEQHQPLQLAWHSANQDPHAR